MNKSQLIAKLAIETNTTQVEATKFLNTYIKIVSETLKNQEPVALVGFGTFDTAKRAARVGRNPKTGEEIQITARVVPVFKAGNSLKDIVNTTEAKSTKTSKATKKNA